MRKMMGCSYTVEYIKYKHVHARVDRQVVTGSLNVEGQPQNPRF